VRLAVALILAAGVVYAFTFLVDLVAGALFPTYPTKRLLSRIRALLKRGSSDSTTPPRARASEFVKCWDAVMGQTLQRHVPAHLICVFNAPTEVVSQTLAARLRAYRCESVQCVSVTRAGWPWGKSSWWSVAAEDVNPPPLTIDGVTGWIERMVMLGADVGAEFCDWGPIEAESRGKWRISDPQTRQQPLPFELPPPIV
jgi:hypothetical protein